MHSRRYCPPGGLIIRKAIIRWYSKRQNTVETSTYGSKLVAMRLAMEALLDIRYSLRMMGLHFDATSYVLCDNHAVIVNTQLPSSTTKKKHTSVAYHKCCEMIAAGIAKYPDISTAMQISAIY